jgi:hypothetical protein
MLTGEPLPVEKSVSDKVTGGTINSTGGLVMRAERVGAATTLSRIVELVAEAQQTRAPIESLTDKVVSWFVPAVVTISLLTFAIWFTWGPEPALAFALTNTVAVLIIACPCALGMATPMSVIVGVGRGATAGVLIRHAEAIEHLAKLTLLAIDKTGTLTEGKPTLTEIFTLPGQDESALLRLSASLESGSEHPLAAAVISAATARGFVLTAPCEFQSHTGAGIEGLIEGRRVHVGCIWDRAVLHEPPSGRAIRPRPSLSTQQRAEPIARELDRRRERLQPTLRDSRVARGNLHADGSFILEHYFPAIEPPVGRERAHLGVLSRHKQSGDRRVVGRTQGVVQLRLSSEHAPFCFAESRRRRLERCGELCLPI